MRGDEERERKKLLEESKRGFMDATDLRNGEGDTSPSVHAAALRSTYCLDPGSSDLPSGL